MKYILVSGGVISGIGKGILASSIGTALKSYGINVTSIKIDPYINIDAGTFSPYEHGEVFVLDDGGEVDLDLGNYERFLDITLTRDNNITTGKIYEKVIREEREGAFLGKTVQVVPHVTDAIQEWVERVAVIPVDGDLEPEVCIIELGGTVGDIESMPFIEAFRQFQFRVSRENFCCCHVSLVPQPKTTGEHKTKPTQASVRELRGTGLSPDIIVCRSQTAIDSACRNKISMFCHVLPEQVFNIYDVSSVYHVPMLLEDEGMPSYFIKRLNLKVPEVRSGRLMVAWRGIADRLDNLRKTVSVGIVGKYTRLEDSYASLLRALRHAAAACDRQLVVKWIDAEDLEHDKRQTALPRFHDAWSELCQAQCILVPGGFGNRGIEGKIAAINYARINKVPFFGICLGLQCAVIEFARDVCDLKDSDSTEINPDTANPVVMEMPEHNPTNKGGTMRLGCRETVFVKDGILKNLYGGVDRIYERHRHRYEVNPKYVEVLEKNGFNFVGHSSDGKRMEVFELADHPYFVGVQYHPEYLSRPLRPSPPFIGLILAVRGKLEKCLQKGTKIPLGARLSALSDSENFNTEGSENSALLLDSLAIQNRYVCGSGRE